MSPEHLELSHDMALSMGSAPHSPHVEMGAVGGSSTDYSETSSIMNELPPHCFGELGVVGEDISVCLRVEGVDMFFKRPLLGHKTHSISMYGQLGAGVFMCGLTP